MSNYNTSANVASDDKAMTNDPATHTIYLAIQNFDWGVRRLNGKWRIDVANGIQTEFYTSLQDAYFQALKLQAPITKFLEAGKRAYEEWIGRFKHYAPWEDLPNPQQKSWQRIAKAALGE